MNELTKGSRTVEKGFTSGATRSTLLRVVAAAATTTDGAKVNDIGEISKRSIVETRTKRVKRLLSTI